MQFVLMTNQLNMVYVLEFLSFYLYFWLTCQQNSQNVNNTVTVLIKPKYSVCDFKKFVDEYICAHIKNAVSEKKNSFEMTAICPIPKAETV